jgi:6 kDa early secretory antigenic target
LVTLDGLLVDHAGLDEAADDLMRIVTRIDARIHDLERELEPLRTSWIGDAQRAYAVAAARWDGAITEMRDLLSATSQQVRRSNLEYRAADARGARSFEG